MLRRLATVIVALAPIACDPPPREIPVDAQGIDASTIDAAPDAYVDICKVNDDLSGVGLCTDRAMADSFDPDIQWTWTGPPGFTRSIVTPLVANLTDDNADGAIDLCDIPDVVVVASPQSGPPGSLGRLFILDGKTGALELAIPTDIDGTVTPALGDLDHDGIPDIVTVDHTGKIVIFDHTGATAGPAGQWAGDWYDAALALADLDHDGSVEIIGGTTVFDDKGVVKWSVPGTPLISLATTTADLDGDGFQEVITGDAAYRYDGALYWDTHFTEFGIPQIGNLDADPRPEVLITNRKGVSLLDHDGHIHYRDFKPGPGIFGVNAWVRPAAIHDFDGDGSADFAMCSQSYFSVFDANGTVRWSSAVSDNTGVAGGTAFDFLGDGYPESVFADEKQLFVFGATGVPLLQIPRTSGTLIEYPVVADIDNDGSAEIVVVSNKYPGLPESPTVQVIRDRYDRWIQARRIWNEHTYHVTNVREDGTIPTNEVPSWTRLNTFRTNAQINGASICEPVH